MGSKKRLSCIGISLVIFSLVLAGCDTYNDDRFMNMDHGVTIGMQGNVQDDGDVPSFDYNISEWDGHTADDISADIVGTDADLYYEVNTFHNIVRVVFDGDGATVESSNKDIIIQQTGAYVTVDMATNTVSNVEVIISGNSNNGGLKLYGTKKMKLTLDGVDLTSQRGPAINSQCKKRMFVHLSDGKTNKITDCSSYSDDAYYLVSTDEDRKGCLFSEGNLIFSGSGTLIVSGKQKHGIATDGYLWIRPGVTIVVMEAVKNCIQVKGDSDDGIGLTMNGGLIYANVSSTAGKCIKTDLDVNINGGKLLLNTSGDAVYDESDKDTSSAACIKSDGNINITGGTITLKSIGNGGKGLSADGNISVSGGETTITTTGGKYYYTNTLTSSPKGIKADGNVTISGGHINISVTGVSDGSEGMESKAIMTISGGETYVYAYDDAINATSVINITGGKVYAYALNNDGIDSNGTLTISGGLVVASGATSPECGIDVDNSTGFKINGGTVIAIAGGSLQSKPSSSSGQCCVEYGGLSVSKGSKVAVLDSSNEPILTFQLPKSLSGSFFFSCPSLKIGSSYTISASGNLTGTADYWYGWYSGGSWSGGTSIQSFKISNVITSLGTSSNNVFGGGGMGWR